MSLSFPTFKKFRTLEEAKEVEMLLNENGLKTFLANNLPALDGSFSGSTALHEYEIKIRPLDFEKAQKLLDEHAENLIDDVDDDYYLFDFSDEELYDILLKREEWNEFDYMLARKILEQRGKTVDAALLKSLQKQRIDDLAKPETGQSLMITLGYIAAFFGGFIAIIMGYVLWQSQKTLPDGRRVYNYREKDRSHGKRILILGIVLTSFFLVLKLFYRYGQ